MKPKAKDDHDEGLLEYLEDIIGTTKYKDAIEKSNQELDRLNDERTEKLNRVKYVEKEKNSLEVMDGMLKNCDPGNVCHNADVILSNRLKKSKPRTIYEMKTSWLVRKISYIRCISWRQMKMWRFLRELWYVSCLFEWQVFDR